MHANHDTKDVLEHVYRSTSRTIGRQIVDEFLVIPLASQMAELNSIYVLNALAKDIWMMVQQPTRGHDIVNKLWDEYAVERDVLQEDVKNFLIDLQRVNLVEVQKTTAVGMDAAG